MMSLPELSTVARWNLNIKIILLNNKGHGMCRQTQRQWLGGTYPATSIEGGLGFPDFVKTAEAFGKFCVGRITCLEEAPRILREAFSCNDPTLVEIDIHPDAQLIPQARYGMPIEDGEPALPREELAAQMHMSATAPT